MVLAGNQRHRVVRAWQCGRQADFRLPTGEHSPNSTTRCPWRPGRLAAAASLRCRLQGLRDRDLRRADPACRAPVSGQPEARDGRSGRQRDLEAPPQGSAGEGSLVFDAFPRARGRHLGYLIWRPAFSFDSTTAERDRRRKEARRAALSRASSGGQLTRRTAVRRSPSRGEETTSSSPSSSQILGLRALPTPEGVPV